MKLQLSTLLLAIIGTTHTTVLASDSGENDDCPVTQFCVGKDDNSKCVAGSGQCFAATQLFLNQNSQAAINLFKYGKYCGLNNRCSPTETEAAPCLDPPEACGGGGSDDSDESADSDEMSAGAGDSGIDVACKVHDECLDSAINALAGPFDPSACAASDAAYVNLLNGITQSCATDISGLDRITCDVNFINTLSTTVTANPTGLCDDHFYNTPIPTPFGDVTGIEIVGGHESRLVAAPFCCGAARVCLDPQLAQLGLDIQQLLPNVDCQSAYAFCEPILGLCPQ